MKSKYKVGNQVSADGFRGTVINIKETYRKNVLVVKVQSKSNRRQFKKTEIDTISILEYPDGKLSFMTVIR